MRGGTHKSISRICRWEGSATYWGTIGYSGDTRYRVGDISHELGVTSHKVDPKIFCWLLPLLLWVQPDDSWRRSIHGTFTSHGYGVMFDMQ